MPDLRNTLPMPSFKMAMPTDKIVKSPAVFDHVYIMVSFKKKIILVLKSGIKVNICFNIFVPNTSFSKHHTHLAKFIVHYTIEYLDGVQISILPKSILLFHLLFLKESALFYIS